MSELRVCVGTPDGPRSTVWKVVTRHADVYIISRLMGSATKVSLHASSQGQWSFTSRWAQEKGIPSSQRHIDRWTVRQPSSQNAAHVFRLLFPSTELRTVGPPNKAPSILWIEPPRTEHCVVLEFYLAPEPPTSAPLWHVPFPLIGVLPVASHGSLVLLRNHELLDSAKLSLINATRVRVDEQTRNAKSRAKLPLRTALLLEFEDHTRGFMEISPSDAAAKRLA
jgi:hypothetical protein